jgi:hypothetical protein
VVRSSSPSKLALAVEAAMREAASSPRTVPQELPVVTLDELEQAMGGTQGGR